MFLTQWRVQLLSSVAPSTPLVIIHSCERAFECTLQAHWLSSIAPCRVTGSSLLSLLLSLPALNKVEAETSTKTSNNVVLVFFWITGDPFPYFRPECQTTTVSLRYNMELHAHAFMVIAAD